MESPMNRSVVIIPVLILGVAVVAAGCQSPEATAQTAAAEPAAATVDVPVVTASMGAIEAALEISGTLAPRTRVAVKPRLPGTLEAVLVEIGDAVTTGQVIARIDRREIDAQADAATAAVAVAKAGLETADASLANAALESDRAKVLFEGGALPRQRLDAAQTAHRAGLAQRDLAAASVAQAEASLRRAREVQRDTTITSPLTGFVVERNYDAGAIPGDKIQRRLGTVLPERSLGGLSFLRNRRVENLRPRFPLIRRRGGRQMANLGSGRKPAAMAWGRKRVVLSRWRHADGGRCEH